MSQAIKNIYLIEHDERMQETLADTIAACAKFTLATGSVAAMASSGTDKPQLVLFDIDQQQENPVESLRNILDIAPHTVVVATSRWMDETLEKQMNKLGFVAGLLKPFDSSSLSRLVSQLEQTGDRTQSRGSVISFFSPKGKSGKTTLIVNLAIALAERTGKSVGIVDADIMFADVSVFVDIEPKSTLAEVVRDINFLTPSVLTNYFEEVNPKVKVLCGIRRPEQATVVSAKDISQIINMVRDSFDYILVDTPAGFNPISIAASEAADQTYIVAMQNSTFAIEDLKRALDIFTSLDNWQDRVKLLMTRINAINTQVQNEINQTVGYPVFLIPNEYVLVSAAANKGRMAKDIRRDSALTQQINQLAAAICQAK